jgi:hypothetical protein
LLSETDVGEVVVYNVAGKDIPIVHRVVRKFGIGYATFLPPPLISTTSFPCAVPGCGCCVDGENPKHKGPTRHGRKARVEESTKGKLC